MNSLKSSHFHLTGPPNYQKGRAKVGDGIISATKLLRTISTMLPENWRKN
jgi:hypothetical protein